VNRSQPLDLGLLVTFYEVARTGSVRQAAQRLGRSQPAVSHRLRALEQDLGVRVFEKVGRRLQLSGHGRGLLERCQELLLLAGEIRESVSVSAERVGGELTIGTLPTLASHLLVPELGPLLTEHPDLSLRLRFGLVGALEEELASGRIDVALLVAEQVAECLHAKRLGMIRLAVVAPPLWMPRRRRVAPRELRGLRYLSWAGLDDPTIGMAERYARRHGLSSATAPVIPHIETLRELIARGLGYTIMPAYTALRDAAAGRVRLLEARGLTAGVPLVVATRKSQPLTPTLSAALALTERAAALLP
jgi:LysR family transcriptional regulator, nitrogen assimilation regulatory protein